MTGPAAAPERQGPPSVTDSAAPAADALVPGTVDSGILLLDKPTGMSSNRALQQVKRALSASKAGHAGTLDPLATGMLPLLLGEATKVAGLLLGRDKAYRVSCRLGQVTDTYDADGQVVAERPVPALDRDRIEQALARFRGRIGSGPRPIRRSRWADSRYTRARRGERSASRNGKHIVRLQLLQHAAEHPAAGGVRQRNLHPLAGARPGPGAGLRRPCHRPAPASGWRHSRGQACDAGRGPGRRKLPLGPGGSLSGCRGCRWMPDSWRSCTRAGSCRHRTCCRPVPRWRPWMQTAAWPGCCRWLPAAPAPAHAGGSGWLKLGRLPDAAPPSAQRCGDPAPSAGTGVPAPGHVKSLLQLGKTVRMRLPSQCHRPHQHETWSGSSDPARVSFRSGTRKPMTLSVEDTARIIDEQACSERYRLPEVQIALLSAYRIPDQTLRRPQEGPSFPPWPAQAGQPAPSPA